MGDAAAQQQQKRAFFASFPPTGDKSMNVVSDVHHGSVRTVPLGKIENVVRTDKVPLAVLMNRVGCQVAFQVDFSICFGKAVELCFEGGGGGDIPDAMPLLCDSTSPPRCLLGRGGGGGGGTAIGWIGCC